VEGGEDEGLGDGVVIDVEIVCRLEGGCLGTACFVRALTYLLLDVGDEVF